MVGAPPPDVSDAERLRLEEEIKDLDPKLMQSPSFAQAHSLESMRSLISFLNAQARYYGGNPPWSRRQAWSNRHAQLAIENRNASRTLAFVGRLHWPELEMYLGGIGIRIESAASYVGRVAGARGPAPDAVVAAWKQAAERVETAGDGSGIPAEKVKARVRMLREAVRLRGRCCVSAP